MKKIVLFVAASAFAFGASAQLMNPELGAAHSQFRKEHQARIPMLKESMKPAGTIKGSAKMTGPNSTASQLPADRWFPGEWEEVKAITVTWPYWSVPANWQELGDQVGYYDADPVFSGYGDIYKWNGGNWTSQGFGPIDQLPNCVNYTLSPTSNQMDFTNVFAYLIDAIRTGGAEPWVRVTHLSDSVYVKQHMAYLGLATTGIKWIEGFGNSFWFRDCGPICFYYGEGDTVGMLDFQYYPGRAIDDSLPQIINLQKNLPIWTTSIEWEGGNCIVDGDGLVISSDALYENNADNYGQIVWTGHSPTYDDYEYKASLTHEQVRDSLAYLLGPRGAKVLPAFKYDGGTGHIDLYADMYDENAFVFSKFPDAYSEWDDYATAGNNIDSICSWTSTFGRNFTKTYIPFPKRDNGSNFSTQEQYDNQYTRTYSNHTFVNNVIIQPCFSTVVNGQPSAEWDRANLDSIREAYKGYTLYPIDVRSFDGSGGAIHCITKQIPADSPVRILHGPIVGPQGEAYNSQDASIEAFITNNTGIANAKVMYRVNGGDWQTVNMTAGADNRYSATIPTSIFGTNGVNVDYYISATSNGGKTITKPFTASNGSYFSFGTNGQTSIADAEGAEQCFGQFYPNPATEQASMVIDMQGGKNYSVSIYDLSGREVHSSSLKAEGTIVYSVNAARLASGQYTVVFSNGSERVVRKLVVK